MLLSCSAKARAGLPCGVVAAAREHDGLRVAVRVGHLRALLPLGAPEARDAGVAVPLKGARWEDVFLDGTDKFEGLCALVTDEDGVVVSYEMRDDMKSMLGANRKRRRGECDTDHQRRPDVLWIVRDADNRIVAAVMVEVDEHSHTDRTPECEGGKVCDTFTAICNLAQTEGKGRLAVARNGVVRMPYVLFLRVNPNACDAPGGGSIRIETRICVVAEKVRAFLRTPHAEFHRRADAGSTMLPHVECFYYHTRDGAKNLALYRENDGMSLHFHGNTCTK